MKKRLSRTLCAVIVLLMLFTGIRMTTLHAKAFDSEVRKGVVSVVFHLKNAVLLKTYDGYYVDSRVANYGDIDYTGGSGFFTSDSADANNPSYIITACHVVDDYIKANEGEVYETIVDIGYDEGGWYYLILQAESCEMRIYYGPNDYDVAYVDCYGSTEKVDVAVLRLRNSTDKRVALPIQKADDSMVGSNVYSIGYPGNSDNEYTSASKYAVEDATVKKGIVSKIAVNEGKGVERIQTDTELHHGDSGGPLVTEDGYVIGVNVNVESNSPYAEQVEADYYAISSGELIRFLDKNNIPYMTSAPKQSGNLDNGNGNASDNSAKRDRDEKDDSEGGMPLWLILVIAGGAVVVIGVIILVVVLAGNGKKKAQADAQAQVAQAQAQAQAAQAQAAQAQAQAQQMQMQQQQQPVRKAMLRSLSAQHNGLTLALGAAPIMIGRDPSNCKLVYREGTVGVSGRHCSISYDAASGDFLLTDLRSSYGTFLMNGQKLNANVPYHLKSGESFYVGDPANVIRVELG